MIQEVFKGTVKAGAAAGFVGVLSLFNMGGRFGWSSLSDRVGRKRTYAIFFTLGPLLYIALPYAGRIGSVALFVAAAALIITMYGGGFATIPAYLSDIFGTQFVGAIHGRLLTAWSLAGHRGADPGELHPRVSDRPRGADGAGLQFHDVIMAGLLVVGFLCNLAVRPVEERYYMTDQQLAAERAAAR